MTSTAYPNPAHARATLEFDADKERKMQNASSTTELQGNAIDCFPYEEGGEPNLLAVQGSLPCCGSGADDSMAEGKHCC